jgi:hypothetical protein
MTTHSATLTLRVKPAPHVFSREFEGELVVLDMDGGDYFGLDALGRKLWEGLVAGQNAQEIAVALSAEVDAPVETLEADLAALTHEMLEKGLVQPR